MWVKRPRMLMIEHDGSSDKQYDQAAKERNAVEAETIETETVPPLSTIFRSGPRSPLGKTNIVELSRSMASRERATSSNFVHLIL